MSLLNLINADLWQIILNNLKTKESGMYFHLTLNRLALLCDNVKHIMILPHNVGNIVKIPIYENNVDLFKRTIKRLDTIPYNQPTVFFDLFIHALHRILKYHIGKH